MENRNDPKVAKYFELCFAKRPAVELYDCDKDPYQVNNLAGDKKYAKIKSKLRKQLTDYLVETADRRSPLNRETFGHVKCGVRDPRTTSLQSSILQILHPSVLPLP